MPATIVRLIRELAAYENLVDLVRITEADVLRDGFGERPCFECLLAEADGEAVGLAHPSAELLHVRWSSRPLRRGPVRR